MITISGDITVQDNNGQQITIDADDLGFEVTHTEERQMGPARTWSASWESNGVQVDVSIEEYPVGFPNNGFSINIDGGSLISNNLSAENAG